MLPKQFRDLRYDIFYRLLLRQRVPLVTLGETTHECHWTLCPEGLDARSIVYSGGVGNDITFEHALVKQFGCSVVMIDPSPTGLRTMSRPENRIPQFRFFPIALAGHDGSLNLATPIHSDEGSWYAQQGETGRLNVPCIDLLTLMQQNHHQHIDFLKIDIEGSEYEVIEDILRRRIPVRQICVEFHHHIIPGIKRTRTIRSILKLAGHGYRLVHHLAGNHTFVQAT
jgi:FkbM family methyltransferase